MKKKKQDLKQFTKLIDSADKTIAKIAVVSRLLLPLVYENLWSER